MMKLQSLDLLVAQLAARVVNEHVVERGVLHAERGERLAEAGRELNQSAWWSSIPTW